MGVWLDSKQRGDGWSALDRSDMDGLRAWLEGFSSEEERSKALNKKDEDGRTMLHWAASRGDQRGVELLLEFGAEVDTSDEGGSTPLHSACGANSETVAKLLIEANARTKGDDAVRSMVRKRTATGISCLHYAAGNGSVSLINLLVEAGANINGKDKYGNTPLMRAVSKNVREAVRVLLELGADVDIQNSSGDTAMHMACENGNDESVKMLMSSSGVELLLEKNNDEKTPIDVADFNYRQQLMGLLASAQ